MSETSEMYEQATLLDMDRSTCSQASEASRSDSAWQEWQTTSQSSRAAFLARTYLKQVKRRVSTEIGLDSGLTTSESFATYDHDMCLWRMSQRSLFGELIEYSVTWPRSGMTVNGSAYQRLPLVHRTAETGYSLWPTLLASSAVRLKFSIQQLNNHTMNQRGKGFGAACLVSAIADDYGQYPTAEFAEWLMGYPQGWTELED